MKFFKRRNKNQQIGLGMAFGMDMIRSIKEAKENPGKEIELTLLPFKIKVDVETEENDASGK